MHEGRNRLIRIGKSEISNILNSLGYSENRGLKEIILKKYNLIYPKFKIGSKYRNPKILIPLIVYFYFRLHDINFKKSKLLAVSEILNSDINSFTLQIKRFLSKNYRW